MSDKLQNHVDAAVSSARCAIIPWCTQSIDGRIQYVNTFAERLKTHQSDLARIISEETGKPLWESATEVEAMIRKVAISIRAQEDRRKSVETKSSGEISTTRYKPYGVVAVLGPFNFPGHLPNGHIVPALLAGNTVVFKPSEHTPRTASKMFELWLAAGLPKGVLNLVEGGPDVGKTLVAQDIDGVFFTGSFNTGRAINRALADHPGRIIALEMGGNNPLVVHRVGNLRAAAYATIQSAYLTAGQRCSAARRLIVIEGVECAAFIDELMQMIDRLRVGLYTDVPEPFMGPMISPAAADGLLAAQLNLMDRGGMGLVPMYRRGRNRALLSPGLIDVTEIRDRADEELFGPLLQLIRVRDFDAAIAEANITRFGLTAGLLSDDRSLWEKFYREIRAGVINWNRPLTGASSALPFGGVGDSGNNRPSAYFACDYCSYPVASMESERVTMPEQLLPGIEPK